MPKISSGTLVQTAKGLTFASWCLLAASPAIAAPPAHLALVIGETAYAALPPLPTCASSARSVAAALRHSGFEVTQRFDTTSGETDAELSSFAKRLTDAPGSTAVLYFCGYAAGLDVRSFLLPVSATIERPFDVITQGIVAKSALNAVAAPGTAAGLLALDVFAQPGNNTPVPLDRIAQAGSLPGHGYVAVAETNSADAQTPLAAALANGLTAPTVETGNLVEDLQGRLAKAASAKLIAAVPPATQSYLTGGPPPPPPSPPPAPAPKPKAAEEPVPPKPAEPPPVAAAPASPSPPAAAAPAPTTSITMPDEAQMSLADRRRVQAALAVLGYYGGRVDGQFGQETRAAIRRFQHEIGAEMTGRLTSEQASRLVAGRS